MKKIDDSPRKIADIIGLIDGIAFQTNILALNAAVEAARAGRGRHGHRRPMDVILRMALRPWRTRATGIKFDAPRPNIP